MNRTALALAVVATSLLFACAAPVEEQEGEASSQSAVKAGQYRCIVSSGVKTKALHVLDSKENLENGSEATEYPSYEEEEKEESENLLQRRVGATWKTVKRCGQCGTAAETKAGSCAKAKGYYGPSDPPPATGG